MDSIRELKDLLPVVLFLLPGFVSTGIVGMLVVRKERETFDKVVEAIILTTANLILFSMLQHALEWTPHVKFNHQDFFTAGNLSLMAFCALLIGLGLAWEANNDWLYKRLREWGITKKTTHATTWNETFHGNVQFVVVHLNDGRRAYGYPAFYSDDPTERAVFLEEASWLSEENELHNDKSIGIFLDKESGIELIEFVDFDDEQVDAGGKTKTDASLEDVPRAINKPKTSYYLKRSKNPDLRKLLPGKSANEPLPPNVQRPKPPPLPPKPRTEKKSSSST